MNKSFSKIRHIQESNKMLEKRLLESEETEFLPIEDEFTLGIAIAQCYNDRRSQEETEKLLLSRKGSNELDKEISLINKIRETHLNMSAFGKEPKILGRMYFKDKEFVRGIQEICSKYKIPYMPKPIGY